MSALLVLLLAQDPVLLPPLRELGVFPQYAEAPREPRAAAFGKDGRVYVADAGGHRILVYGADGKAAGGWDGELREPSGVAVGPDGEVFVADRGNGRIRLFDPEGRFLYQWGGLSSPRHVSRYGDRLYVSDVDRVRVFGLRGEPGPVLEGFDRPGGAAADETGNIYVADTSGHRVRSFTRDGAARDAWGSWGAPSGFLSRPAAVAWHAGALLVADTGNHRVQVFDASGKLLRQWGAPPARAGQGGGHLHEPAHVAVSADGAWAAVAEPVDRRVQVFPFRDAAAGRPWYGPAWWERSHGLPPSLPSPAGAGLSVVVALTERGSHSVFFVDVTENTVSRVVARAGGYGQRLGLFDDPVSVAFEPAGGRAWVSDAGNRRVQLLELAKKGSLVRAVAAWSLPYAPGPLAFDGRGRLLVLDAAGTTLELFDAKDMSRVRTLRAPEGARWEGVASDGAKIALADALGCRVQIYDAEGRPLAAWGRRGSAPGDFLRPAGVAIDAEGRVHVVDALLHQGLTFEGDGRFVRAWAGPGLGPTKLRSPASIAFGAPAHLLVDDAGQHLGQVFRMDGRNAGFFLKAGFPAPGGGR